MKRLLAVVILLSLVCAPLMATGPDELAELRREYRTLRWAIELLAAALLSVFAVVDTDDTSLEFQSAIHAAARTCQRVLAALAIP